VITKHAARNQDLDRFLIEEFSLRFPRIEASHQPTVCTRYRRKALSYPHSFGIMQSKRRSYTDAWEQETQYSLMVGSEIRAEASWNTVTRRRGARHRSGLGNRRRQQQGTNLVNDIEGQSRALHAVCPVSGVPERCSTHWHRTGALLQGTLSVSMDTNEELMREELGVVTSSAQMLQRERALLQIVRAHGVGVGFGQTDVLREGSLERDAWPASVLRCNVTSYRSL
jgi:hypothetical protein